MKHFLTILVIGGMLAMVSACTESGGGGGDDGDDAGAGGTHAHEDGDADSHEGHDHSDDNDQSADGGDDAHDVLEVLLGKPLIGQTRIKCAQGHGKVEPGKESHIFVKVAYDDGGATVVRAWIGNEDRTPSMVGTGEFSASRSGWEVHLTAPDPLPDGAMWWIELEKPNGTKEVGSIAFQ